jgi:hypothetical protein
LAELLYWVSERERRRGAQELPIAVEPRDITRGILSDGATVRRRREQSPFDGQMPLRGPRRKVLSDSPKSLPLFDNKVVN